ncbi:UNVERIFIED_CONTAM: putative tatC-like protein ymf16 [Sesamum latifolium]|uniref:TatC-like protein ymf16 n=1 Tax=Sesamum latifolium TaxID=2727402 RepID=A0AAW2VZH1_9LAMI
MLLFHFGYLVPNCRPFPYSLIIELAIFVASIVEVREEGWTSGMRESGSIDIFDLAPKGNPPGPFPTYTRRVGCGSLPLIGAKNTRIFLDVDTRRNKRAGPFLQSRVKSTVDIFSGRVAR